MKAISSLHPDLLQILTEFSDFFYGREFSHLEDYMGHDPKMKNFIVKDKRDEAVSMDYLKAALPTPTRYGFPRNSWGLELSHEKQFIKDQELLNRAATTNDMLMNFFGARNNALQMYYPSGGYIGWHNNCNAPGYNIILSCNPGADGYFDHYDHVEGRLNRYQDESGWNCKVGYFGSDKEPDKIFWHCAATNTPRVTLSYVIYDENLWLDMVDDIDYSR
jgi:hypothetical protein